MRKCKAPGCGVRFEAKGFVVWCSPGCGAEIAMQRLNKAKAQKAKRARKEIRERKERLKPITFWEKKAEAAVNKYVRLRDRSDGCISCHLPATWGGQWHASHLRSVGAASAVRFSLWNIHKACSVCNAHKSGNIGEYLPRVRAKIGDKKVDWLYTQTQPRRYTVEYLQRLQRVFSKKCRRLEKRI